MIKSQNIYHKVLINAILKGDSAHSIFALYLSSLVVVFLKNLHRGEIKLDFYPFNNFSQYTLLEFSSFYSFVSNYLSKFLSLQNGKIHHFIKNITLKRIPESQGSGDLLGHIWLIWWDPNRHL